MKKKLIIMTTAIIRPNLHVISIGEFYRNFIIESSYKDIILENFDIYHIINIDSPEKLLSHFTLENTINNFNKIIPDSIHKIYINTEKPNFLLAFKNIMHKIKELGLISEQNYYWWLEDDWTVQKQDFNFFDQIKNMLLFTNCCMGLVQNTPLGSFRGGPIMNGHYFINHFDIENAGIMNNTCDPEKQISKYITCNKGIFEKKNKIKIRQIVNEYDKNINLVLVYNNQDINKVDDEFMKYYYERNYNKEIRFTYFIVLVNNFQYDKIHYINLDYAKIKNVKGLINNILNYTQTSMVEFKNKFDSKSITYFMVKPYIIDDCGRDYAIKYNLVKGWSHIGDEITYK
jgi:hypothetical protein